MQKLKGKELGDRWVKMGRDMSTASKYKIGNVWVFRCQDKLI